MFNQSIFEASVEEIALEDPEYPYIVSVLHKATRTNGIDALLSENEVDILVSPTGRPSVLIDPMNGDRYIGGVGATSLAAIAGYPHLTAPMGVVHGLPVGVSFIGAAHDDARVLAAGHAYESVRTKWRRLNSDCPSTGPKSFRRPREQGGSIDFTSRRTTGSGSRLTRCDLA